jgi:hypothetical protein
VCALVREMVRKMSLPGSLIVQFVHLLLTSTLAGLSSSSPIFSHINSSRLGPQVASHVVGTPVRPPNSMIVPTYY